MDKKRKIIAIIGMLIGVGFLYLGFTGMKDQHPIQEEVVIEEAVDTNSADALGNIQ